MTTATLHDPPATTAGTDDSLLKALLEIAPASAAVANFCDHLEHCEAASRDDVLDAAAALKSTAVALAATLGVDLRAAYAERLTAVERRSPLYPLEGFDVADAVARARTWSDLQHVQARHDRLYHLDVVGLQKQDQLRHCALHLAKLAGALAVAVAQVDTRPDFARRRLPDLVLFALKLATLFGQRLEGELDELGNATALGTQ